MNIKKFIYFTLITLCFHSVLPGEFSFNDFDLDGSEPSLNLEEIDSHLLEAAIQDQTMRANTPSEILKLIYSQAHLNRILCPDLYKYTYPLPTRNIITYPSLMNFTPRQSQSGFSLFYQHTANMFPWCNNLEGYLNLFDADLLREVDIEIAHEYNVDIPESIGLFKNARVEQHRAGFLFDLWGKISWFNIGIELPFYAVAKHYNLPEEDVESLKTASIFTLLPTPSDNDCGIGFANIHPYVLETRIGLGSSRITLSFDAINTDRFRLVLGTKLTLPTEATFSCGFIGSNFKKIVQRGYLNLETLVEKISEGSQAEKDEALSETKTFGLQAINQMGALLLATQLGEDHRFQVALYAEPTLRIDENVTLVGAFRINWMNPKMVNRFVKEQISPCCFCDNCFDPDDFPEDQREEMSENALNFLSNRLRNWVFPCCYNVKLITQREYQMTVAALMQFTDNWKFLLGYDYWGKQQEGSRLVCQQGTTINMNCIKLCNALLPRLSQHKLFTKIEYTKFKESHNFIFTFGADVPLESKNISNDYTGFINFEWSF